MSRFKYFIIAQLFLGAVSFSVAADTYRYLVAKNGKLSDFFSELKPVDQSGNEIVFQLSPGVSFSVDDSRMVYATFVFEAQGRSSEGMPTVVVGEKVFFTNPVVFRDATLDASGCIRIEGPWQDNEEVDGSTERGYWNPRSFEMACNLEITSPLSYRNETDYFQTQSIVIPSGRTLSLTCPVKNGKRLPNVSFEDETSTLAFAGEEWESFPEKYQNLLTSSSGHFVFESDVTIEGELKFTGSPTIEVVNARVTLNAGIAQGEGRPTLRLVDGGLDGAERNTPIFLSAPEGEPFRGLEVEGETELRNVKLDALTGSGTVKIATSAVSSVERVFIKAGDTLVFYGDPTKIALPFSRVYGSGTLSLNQVSGTPQEIDATLRAGGFTGALALAPTTYFRIDFSALEESEFPYAFIPQVGGIIGQNFRMRLEQYAKAKFSWPTREVAGQGSPSLTLIEAGPYAGRAEVPAFPKWVDFTFLRADGKTEIDCTVAYGEETNVLTWKEPAYEPSGFWGLPVDVSTEMAGLIPEGKTAGEVTGPHTVEESAEALRCFTGIAKAEARQEDATVVDLRVDYAFGISRLTFVDSGKNILIEVSLSSTASDAPDFLVAPILAVNGKSLPSQPLTPEEIAKRKLSAPTGKAVRWFLIPYSTLSKTGNLVFTVSANPPQTN